MNIIFIALAGLVIYMFLKINKSQNSSHVNSPKNRQPQTQRSASSISQVSLETSIELPADFDLSDEFKQAFNLMENSKQHIFITGKAGTGKSTLLHYFRLNTKKNIVVLAPTGVAAIKAHGQTIHSFFKLPPRFIQKEHVRRLRKRDLIKKIDTLVIDECSMLRADLLDGIDCSLRVNREKMNVPFGGVQIILFGDLFQLPPVVGRDERDLMERLYHGPYFFNAHIIENIKLQQYELTKIYRQKELHFIELLNKIRIKECSGEDLSYLNECHDPSIESGVNGILTLTTTNNGANNINEKCLSRVKGREYLYRADIRGDFDESLYPTEVTLRLKRGAQVMLIKNDKDRRWVNGTLAEVTDLSNSVVKVRVKDNIYTVPRDIWQKIRYVFNEDTNKIEEEVIGSFEQLPLKLAWAITIHKSQGQTFDKLIIDIENGAFTHGQTYVALSRCTSLKGLLLKRPIIDSDILFDNRIYEFLNKNSNKWSYKPVADNDKADFDPVSPKQIKIIKSVSGTFSNIPERERISISKIKDSKCPFKYFKNYIEKPREEKPFLSIELGLGQFFHNKVEKLFKTIAAQQRLIKKEDTLSTDGIVNEFELSFLWDKKLRKPYKIIRHDFDYFKDRLANITNNFNRGVVPKLIGHKVIKPEGNLEIKTNDYAIRGKYDLLTQDQNGRILLWDWKTGAAPKPDYYEDFTLQKIQLGIYAIWVRYKYKTENVKANAVFLRDNAYFLQEVFEYHIEKKVVDFIDFEHRNLKEITDYIPIPDNLCQWCSWNSVCPG